MKSWSRRRKVVTAIAGVGLVWLGLLAWSALQAMVSLQRGAEEVRAVRQQASVEALVEPETAKDLDQAHDAFAAAEGALGRPVWWPVKALPVLGRQVRAAQDVAATGAAGTAVAADGVAELTELTERPVGSGPERVATVRDLSAVAGRIGARLGELEAADPDGLVGPLGDAVVELDEQLAEATAASEDLEAASAALAGVLEGPEPYLLLGANNAEMRNGSGMFLSAAELSFDDGSLELGDVSPTAELVLPAGRVPVQGDLAENWPWLDPGRDLRNLGLTADFPQSAEVAVRNWERTDAGGKVGGVIAIDVDGIRSLLRVVGPVEVDGVRYSADDVRGLLLRDQYQTYEADRTERRDRLGEVARAIFERIDEGRWDLAELATELSESVRGRHLLVWSADPQVQEAWASVGADGHLDQASVSAALLNRGANKLDSWIETTAEVETGEPRRSDGRRRISLTYEIANTSDGSGPRYVVGPNLDDLEAGDHRALALFNLPAGTTDVRLEGARSFLQGGDGPTVVVAGELDVPAGQRRTVTVTGLLPEGLDRLTIEPSARIPRTRWVVDGEELTLDRRASVALDRGSS